ncbi:hypothetical protein SASPL_155154 [Salvia splendens]|uniref:KIB1-4 beta-propeller domain-containing protein n=1 Tax=Salvia splendens TaxID=180675 RepID=A0A8X8YZD3_SALSN|nr:uncharacterized protein LOC121786949 [Salvia splendens]KAG6386261.1 hypothetical protein SASPL_155154 [Salvia splendens]
MASSSSSSSPFLMLPVADENTKKIQHLSFYNFKNNKPYNRKLPPTLKNTQFQCIGSSKGWHTFLDQTLKNPFLFNPFSQTLIHLPQNHPDITKLILSQDPSLRPHTYAAIAIQTPLLSTKLSYSRNRDATWHALPNQSNTYYDAIFCHATNTLFALAPALQVESWNLNDDSPTKSTIIRASYPRSLRLAKEAFPSDLYSSQLYLALASRGDIIVAVRYVGEFVRYDGEAVYEGDTLTDYMAAPLVCPYRTMGVTESPLIQAQDLSAEETEQAAAIRNPIGGPIAEAHRREARAGKQPTYLKDYVLSLETATHD